MPEFQGKHYEYTKGGRDAHRKARRKAMKKKLHEKLAGQPLTKQQLLKKKREEETLTKKTGGQGTIALSQKRSGMHGTHLGRVVSHTCYDKIYDRLTEKKDWKNKLAEQFGHSLGHKTGQEQSNLAKKSGEAPFLTPEELKHYLGRVRGQRGATRHPTKPSRQGTKK